MQDGSASATRHTTASSACGVTDQEFTDFVKTYRVLLTRGLRGCYVTTVCGPAAGECSAG
jgi:hypothetical protein